MGEGLLVVGCIALLLAAAGLMLWQWAATRQIRHATGLHLQQQIHASFTPETPALSPMRNAPASGAGGATPLSDPWTEAAATESAAAPRKNRIESLIPAWLEGAIGAPTVVLGVVAIIVLTILAASLGGWPAAAGSLLLLLLLASFTVWLRLQKFRRQLVGQLPAFIDSMVRLITIGNSTQAAFQLAIPSSRAPLRGYLDRAGGLVRAGVDLDKALHQMASRVHIEEMFLLASILGLGVRYGGRADLLLERVANFMRDREQAEHELIALSAETRLSAWILGLLPVGVGAVIITLNPAYFLRMWHDTTGQYMVFGALGLQLLGAFLLYRLARFT
ncbi:type II secretion system F family protein [Variovorax sp. PAMC26660]|uniref:type II secretion system F family protein n=1 Tax=Variovorax sp. PAMC26660 TaxID=2762322 RepID=UPI00164D6411|nr:type II secretion system F family protein [Variovorax sp. PAMC26660]QNK69449.1 type II secretion system F family protein [Variovorax sp. PAMC26660]